MNDSEALALWQRAVPSLTPAESLFSRAVSRFETHYGAGWGKGRSSAGAGSHNMGAVTVSCDSELPKFRHADSRFDEQSGQVVQYETCFRAYDTPEAGVEHFVRVLLKPNVRDALPSLPEAVAAMRDNSYFLGVKPRAEAIQDYAAAVRRNRDAIVRATGEPDALTELGEAGALGPLLWLGAAAAVAWLLVTEMR